MRTIARPMHVFASAVVAHALISLGPWTPPALARAVPAAAPADTAAGGAALRVSLVCYDCHADRRAALVGTPHQAAADSARAVRAPATARVACTDCHRPDPRHWESDPAQYPMGNPAKASADTVAAICSRCHLAHNQQALKAGDAHADNGVTCAGCHEVHGGHGATLLRAPEPDLCYSCHQETRGQFAKPSRHPVADGVMTCSDCHLKGNDWRPTLNDAGTNTACYNCHDQFRGPFPFEHQATLDFSTEEGGCVTCHDPHGAYEPRMLKQSYAPPDFATCKQCHVVPGHNFNPEHGTRWAGVPCNQCHVDIHGSYDNRFFLSPALRAQGCGAVGCHNF